MAITLRKSMPKVITSGDGVHNEPVAVDIEVGQTIILRYKGYDSFRVEALVIDLTPYAHNDGSYRATLLLTNPSTVACHLMSIEFLDVVSWNMRPFMVTHEDQL